MFKKIKNLFFTDPKIKVSLQSATFNPNDEGDVKYFREVLGMVMCSHCKFLRHLGEKECSHCGAPIDPKE
jgi:hypothetical protein